MPAMSHRHLEKFEDQHKVQVIVLMGDGRELCSNAGAWLLLLRQLSGSAQMVLCSLHDVHVCHET